MELFTIIMAGGVGARFWPRSREKKPKQLLKIFGEKSLIQDTVERLEGFVDYNHILIITNKVQKEELKNQLPRIPEENIIEEPFGKNTAAAIGLASIIVQKKSKDAITIILPADHIIRGKEDFQNTLRAAAEFAYKGDRLVTIGINPSRPETGYGYIQIDDNKIEDNIYKVLTFAEKPNYATAVRFIESGDFLWNSGMFIWKIDTILNEMKELMPELYEGLMEIDTTIGTPEFESTVNHVYGQIKSVSIDYGIMESSPNVFLTRGQFIWSDVGSWEEVYQLTEKDGEGNAVVGNVYTQSTSDSYIYSPQKFTAVLGIDNIIVINSEDSLLICKRDKSQVVKNVVDYLKMKKLTDYL